MRGLVLTALCFALAGAAFAADPKSPADNKAYLEQAAKEKGAQVMPSGLVYIEQKAGTGKQPGPTSVVSVNYRGTLIDGKQFDASSKPIEFGLNQVIPCWTEGVAKMKVGGKAKLVCPAAIAYQDRGVPQAGIGPGATLVFEVELLGVK